MTSVFDVKFHRELAKRKSEARALNERGEGKLATSAALDL